jgi:hypothetical protein
MGWREGQGTGPRRRDIDKGMTTHDIRKVSGNLNRLIMYRAILDDDIEYRQEIKLAPKNEALISFKQKQDLYGLGYDPLQNIPKHAREKLKPLSSE